MESFGTSPSDPHPPRRRRYDFHLSPPGFLHFPAHAFLDFLGLLRAPSQHPSSPDSESASSPSRLHIATVRDLSSSNDAEVSIRITAMGPETEDVRIHADAVNGSVSSPRGPEMAASSVGINSEPGGTAPLVNNSDSGVTSNERDAGGSHRYDFQQLARWIEQVLPFAVLLLIVFIRQHLEGFLVTLWISAVMVKSNDILRKQTALKGERKNLIIITIGIGMLLQIVGIYWWFKKEDLFRPLLLLPPKQIPIFWHAIFIIVVNDILIRQGAMVLKCGLLLYFKNTRGRHYRRQGQFLTFIEYFILLYRTLLPAPVWYRFFLNKEYGSLFSSLITGLYLTFKLTSVLEKVRTFIAAFKGLSGREVQYGSYATAEEVLAAGDLCAICQEKMHAPILLSCKHIFCEDCVSEWFDRERTCPLCRAVVKPAELRSYGDGSTNLLYQVF